MRILVVGGAGYIGSSLVPALLECGHQVDVIDLLWFGNHLPPQVKVVKKNLFECRQSDFEGYEQIVFLAGLSNDPMAEYDPVANFISNGALPSYLAYLAKRSGVKRFIYASSCSVYGYTESELYDEEHPVTSYYPYGISKLQGERGVLQMQYSNFSTIALRKGTVCGYSPRMRFDLIINTMYKTCSQGGLITVNNPSIWRPIVHIQDAVNAYIKAVQADYGVSGVFNVASDNYTVGQVAGVVKDEFERLTGKEIRIECKNRQDARNYMVAIEKAKRVLGFKPQYGIADIVRHLHQHRDGYGDFEQDIFSNIKTFMRINPGKTSYA